ncbi:MAG: hypothetical protein IJZ80_01145 [Clostridia bacterium]|nr:hypothetical protein [Clostridia bacterium]
MERKILFIIAILCLLLTVMLVATSCQNSDDIPPVDTELSLGALIAGGEDSQFSIVYPARWEDYEMNAAMDLKYAFSAVYQSFPKLIDDSKPENEYEILIGNTNRPESASVLEGLSEYGWVVRVIGNKIVINAKSGQFLTDAVEHFSNIYIGSTEQLGINHIADHIENSEKADQSYVISVGKNSVYTVSCLSSGSSYIKSSALSFSQRLSNDHGVFISVSTDGMPSSGKAILLATDEKIDGWQISFEENGNISILGQNDALAVCALNYFTSEYMKKDADGDIVIQNTQTVSESATDYAREGWLLAAPAYDGGTLAPKLYDCGTGMQNDNSSPSAERSFMMCISGTTATQFNNYQYKLSDCGYTVDSENVVPCSNGKYNLFYGYQKDNQYLWVYYLANTGEVRVIEDRVSTLESEFEYSFDYDNNTGTEIYLYGMKYHPQGMGYGEVGGSLDSTNNGLFVIIKQVDDSLFLIDGGFTTQASSAAVRGLWDFIHEITGKAANEKIVISCWFVTHPHNDHYALVSSLINNYHQYLDLQRVMFNFPTSAELTGNMGIEANIRTAVRQYFPNAMFAKCHTGQSIHLGSMTIDVMTTHEDAVSATTGKNTITEGNSMTSILRFTFADGTRYMELGDFTEERESALLGMYSDAAFKCQISDVAHHGFNQVQRLYNKISARYVLWSNYPADDWSTETESAAWRKVVSASTLAFIRSANPNVEIYYAGLNTTKLECRGGTVTVTKLPLVY